MISFADYIRKRLDEESAAGMQDAQRTQFNSLYQGENYPKAKKAIEAKYKDHPMPMSAFMQDRDGGKWEWLWRAVYGSRESGND